MAFNLEKLFTDVFAPRNEVVTVMYDLPTSKQPDHIAWAERRSMATDWHDQIVTFSGKYKMQVNPVLTYTATGTHNADLPSLGESQGKKVNLQEVLMNSTIVIAMPQFSPSAPLLLMTKKNRNLRVASMPLVTRAMEKTGLSADYNKIASECETLAELFEHATGIEVYFSTGHFCHFDISDNKMPLQDNGMLHKGARDQGPRLRNLPSGEVCVAPVEKSSSKTAGLIPVWFRNELMVLKVDKNKIVDVEGKSRVATRCREKFQEEPAMANIAEVAIGCNDKAVVTGNILEDEKAGFHWAYGRSDHLEGCVGVEDFSSPDKVVHQDIVYAKGSPIEVEKLDFINPGGKKVTAIRNGVRVV
jgi:leucyl aminopeptidase (aminopeptidase T)